MDELREAAEAPAGAPKRLPERQVGMMARHVLTALKCAHKRKIWHKDIKPENIMWNGMIYKLCDFGIASVDREKQKAMSASYAQSTRILQHMAGTPSYMSPEQLRADGIPDGRSDFWSLGVTMYYLLSGVLPFGDLERFSISEITGRVLYLEPKPLQEVTEGAVSDALALVVEKAMSKNPDDRYQTAAEMLEDLRQALKDYDIFISYRRTYNPLAQALKICLTAHGYVVFLDSDRVDGIQLGEFQKQLEEVMRGTGIMLVICSQAPSGPAPKPSLKPALVDRSKVTSMEQIAEYDKHGPWRASCRQCSLVSKPNVRAVRTAAHLPSPQVGWTTAASRSRTACAAARRASARWCRCTSTASLRPLWAKSSAAWPTCPTCRGWGARTPST